MNAGHLSSESLLLNHVVRKRRGCERQYCPKQDLGLVGQLAEYSEQRTADVEAWRKRNELFGGSVELEGGNEE